MKKRSEFTTLCYIEDESRYLMLQRTAKEKDVNKDKWIGVGGHFEAHESPEDCLLREVKEETGLTLISWRFRGIVTFTLKTQGVPESKLLALQENMARALTINWRDYDYAKEVKW